MHFLVGQYSCDVCHSQFFTQDKENNFTRNVTAYLRYKKGTMFCQKVGQRNKKSAQWQLNSWPSVHRLGPLATELLGDSGERGHTY